MMLCASSPSLKDAHHLASACAYLLACVNAASLTPPSLFFLFTEDGLTLVERIPLYGRGLTCLFRERPKRKPRPESGRAKLEAIKAAKIAAGEMVEDDAEVELGPRTETSLLHANNHTPSSEYGAILHTRVV